MQKSKIEPPFVRSPYNYDRDQASQESGVSTGTENGAKQSFKDECDINTIVERFGLGYELPQNSRVPEYGDFSNITTFQEAMNATAAVREEFDKLPANIRSKFGNDPALYVDFCLDENNREELRQMGLLNKEAVERLEKAEEEARKQAAKPIKDENQGDTP